jgi:GTP-binding protein
MRENRDNPVTDDDADGEPVEAPLEPLLGTVAIVGFPNVGKSTLINRLTQSRAAVVHDLPGVTRDRKELICEWSGHRFRLVDTGGVDIASADPLVKGIAVQARAAIDQADLVLFVVDARHGITPGDEELAAIIRAAKTPVILVANKIDDPIKDILALEFHRLGLGDPFPLSALHGNGTGDLLDLVVEQLPGDAGLEVGSEAIRVAILGRPNVGKSSLLNALVGSDRVLVSEIPGTTRDAIDTVLTRGETTFILVDTAGLRRKRHQRQGVDYYSELRALDAASRADVALVLIDASEGLVEQDLSVADEARKAQCSTLVVLSKWDLTTIEMETIRPELTVRLRQRPPVVAISAKTGRGLQKLLDRVEELARKHSYRIPTPELNRFLGELSQMRQAPSKGPKKLNLLYGTQIQTRPPRIRIFVNDPGLVTRDYGYWVENQFRERFELQGVPVSIDFVGRG